MENRTIYNDEYYKIIAEKSLNKYICKIIDLDKNTIDIEIFQSFDNLLENVMFFVMSLTGELATIEKNGTIQSTPTDKQLFQSGWVKQKYDFEYVGKPYSINY